MAGNMVKEMTTNFRKLDKFERYDFRRWQKKMHFLLTKLIVVYVLTTPMSELVEDAIVEEGKNKNNKQNKGKKHDFKEHGSGSGSNKKPKLECWKCGKTSHFKRDCHSVSKKNANAGGSGKRSVLYMGDDHFAPVHGKGSVVLEFGSGKSITLFNVLYVLKLRFCYYNNGMFMLNLNKVMDDSDSVYMSSSTVVNSILCIFVGYAELSKAYRFYVIEPNDSVSINSTIKSRDAIFDENRFSLIPRPKDIIPNSGESQRDDHSDDVPSEIIGPRKGKRVEKAKSYGFDFQLYLVEGLRDQKKAINDEIGYIMENNTWVLSDLPPGCKLLVCKWIFKRKMKVDGTIDKFKAQLVIQGFRQKEGNEYFDTCAPVARITTIRLLLALTAIHNLVIYQMGVETTFLNGDLDEKVDMKQPEGFVKPGNEHKVCKLVKSLYGLKQAPKQWHQKFDEVMLSSGFLLNQSDKFVYRKFDSSGKGAIIYLYVDDMLIFGTYQNQVDKTKKFLSSKFSMKDMGEADVILDIKIKRESQRDDHSDDVPSEILGPRKAINDEIGSIMKNNTWVLSDLPPGCKLLVCKWIFKRKMKVDGIIDKFKAQLVIQGFRQKEGNEYFDTYAPVARITTIRLLLALTAIHNLVIYQMGVKTTFLNGDLDEKVDIKQPEGFVKPGNEHKVCKLVKSLYGLKQAPKQWHQEFDEVMLSSGFLLNQSDKFVYSKFDSFGKCAIICLYVDDMLIFGTYQNQVDKTKKFLSSKFSMKDMGEADVILDIKIKRENKGIVITQSHYIEKILKKINREDCSSVSTPMDPLEKLKPNTGRLSRFTSNPSRQHWQAITRAFKYLKGTMNYGLSYVGYPSVLDAYSDASWINHVEDSSSRILPRRTIAQVVRRTTRIMTIIRSGLTPKAIKEMITQRVAEALAEQEANRNLGPIVKSESENGDDNKNRSGE
nr:zinc finger, CCHC-type [Tanacetum cinerariifolium]